MQVRHILFLLSLHLYSFIALNTSVIDIISISQIPPVVVAVGVVVVTPRVVFLAVVVVVVEGLVPVVPLTVVARSSPVITLGRLLLVLVLVDQLAEELKKVFLFYVEVIVSITVALAGIIVVSPVVVGLVVGVPWIWTTMIVLIVFRAFLFKRFSPGVVVVIISGLCSWVGLVVMLGRSWGFLVGSIVIIVHLHLHLDLLFLQECFSSLGYDSTHLQVNRRLHFGFDALSFDSPDLIGRHSIIIEIQLELDFAGCLLFLNEGYGFWIDIGVLGSIRYGYRW